MDTTINSNKLDGNSIIWAVIASIMLHIFIAVIVPNFDFSQPIEKRQVLKIELQKPAPAPAPVAVIEPAPPVEIPEPPKPKPKPIEKKPKPVVKPKPIKKEIPAPVEEPEITPPPVVEDIIAVQPTVESKPEVVVPQPPPLPKEPPPPPEPTQAEVDNALRAYGNLLGKAIAKHKSYPKIAQRRGWQGTALLDLKIDSNGNVLAAVIRDSSGYDTLDKRALEMVKKAAPFPAPPKALQGRTFNLTVPVSFKLSNG